MQLSGISRDQFQQFPENLFLDLGRPSHALSGQYPFQTGAITLVDTAGHGVFAAEEDSGNLWHTGALGREQNDRAVTFQADVGAMIIEPMNSCLFLGGQRTDRQFAWSAHVLSMLCEWDAAFHFTRFPAVVAPLYLETC